MSVKCADGKNQHNLKFLDKKLMCRYLTKMLYYGQLTVVLKENLFSICI